MSRGSSRRNPPPGPACVFGDDTSHLVIGATGNIGPHLIQQLADMGAATIVAVSRNPGARLDGLAQRLASTEPRWSRWPPTPPTRPRYGAVRPVRHRSSCPGGHLPRRLRRRPGDAARYDRRRRERDVPPEAGRGGLLHSLSLRTTVRQFVLFSSISGLLGSRWLGALHRDQHLSRHLRLRPPGPRAARHRRELGAVEIAGRHPTRRAAGDLRLGARRRCPMRWPSARFRR